jgi:hypothetical protein
MREPAHFHWPPSNGTIGTLKFTGELTLELKAGFDSRCLLSGPLLQWPYQANRFPDMAVCELEKG